MSDTLMPRGSRELIFAQDVNGNLIVVFERLIPIEKGQIFNTPVLANTNFFLVDLLPTNSPTIFKIFVSLDTAGVLNVQRTVAGITIVENLNENAALAANALYEFQIAVRAEQSINLQTTVAATILSCIVMEVPAVVG